MQLFEVGAARKLNVVLKVLQQVVMGGDVLFEGVALVQNGRQTAGQEVKRAFHGAASLRNYVCSGKEGDIRNRFNIR